MHDTATIGNTRLSAARIACLGISQVIGWGSMHYLIAVFATPIATETGWRAAFVQSGFSLSLVVMALVSPAAGRWIDSHGGRRVLIGGCLSGAAGCMLLATSRHGSSYLAGWVLLGLGMRMALYDAAFATLAHVVGPAAKRPMAIITLFGGLASTLFWPLGQTLEQSLGWRNALWVYAALLAASSLLHLGIPDGRHRSADRPETGAAREKLPHPGQPTDVLLYATIAVLMLFMQTGLAAHFIDLLRGLGWSAATAGLLAAGLGIGQFTGRAWVVAWGHRLHATKLNLVCCCLLLLCFAVALAGGDSLAGAATFAIVYGAGNGIATIARGALPLLLFNATQYGRAVGKILRPAFLFAAVAPVAIAQLLEHAGLRAMLVFLFMSALVLLAASVALAWRIHSPRSSHDT